MSEPQETRKPNRFRITSIIIAMAVAGLMMGTTFIPFLNERSGTVETQQLATTLTGQNYDLQNYVMLWQRRNGSDPEYPYGNANPSASAGMTFFGTNVLVLSMFGGGVGYNWAAIADPSLIPTNAKLVLHAYELSNYMDIADHAKLDSRIIGAEWDDFPVSQQSPANMTAIYSALHHEDANLSQGPLKLYLVVYNNGYYKQSPYSWADIAAYFDVINFWFYPTVYAVQFQEHNGYSDAFLEFRSWLPTKEFKLGVYLHLFNDGEYAYSVTLEHMIEGARLIRQGYATGWTILENQWILVNPNSAHLVRNFLFQEFLPNYASSVTVSTLAVSSTKSGISIPAIVGNVRVDPITNGLKLYSDHFQRVTIVSSWASPKVQNVLTGEFEILTTGTGSFSFIASPGAEYRVYNRALTAVTYTAPQYILAPTTWESKEILFREKVFVNSTLRIKNSTIRFSDYEHQKTVANGTIPHYGLTLNQSGFLYIDNSTFEPQNRMFPYYFNLTGDGGTNKIINVHNSTFACYAGTFQAYGYFYIHDSVLYQPAGNGGSHFGLWLASPSWTNTVMFRRNIVSLQQVDGSKAFVNPGTGYPTTALIRDNIFVGGGGAASDAIVMDNSASYSATMHNITLAPSSLNETGGNGTSSLFTAWRDFSGSGTQPTSYFNITTNFVLKGRGITSFGGTLKDADGHTIGTLSTTNGTVIIEIQYLSFHDPDTIRSNPFPWTFTVTNGLQAGSFYQIRDESYWNGGYNQMMGPRTLSFNSSTFTINLGQSSGLILEKRSGYLTLGTTSYVTSVGPVSTMNQAYWQPWNYTGLQLVPVFGYPSAGTLSIRPSLYDSTQVIVAEWTAEGVAGATATFSLSGLESGRMYRLYIDGNQDALLTASGSGVISFTYSGPWSEHQFEIVATSITGSISPLVNLVFLMFAVGIIVGVVAEGTNSIRKMQMRTTQQMVKSLLNMVIYIVIGMASLGIMYAMV